MKIKRILCMLFAFVCALSITVSLSACKDKKSDDTKDSQESEDFVSESESESDEITEEETEDTFPYENTTYHTAAVQDQLKIVGRGSATQEGILADWSGSGIEFTAKCKGTVKITITASVDCVFKMFTDGQAARTVDVMAGTRSYMFALGVDPGEHSFRLLKMSAVEKGNQPSLCTITQINLNGELRQRPEDKELLIEFIGDSITCGVGSLAENLPNTFGSYAFLCAEKLNTDYSMVCISGIGLLKSTDRHGGLNMLTAYPYTNYYRSKTELHSAERQADLVILNLNTNDKGGMTEDRENEYKAQAKSMLQAIRALHGNDVKIVWTFGMMKSYGSGYCDVWATEVLSELGGETAGYYYVTLPINTSGVASHPSSAGHEHAANKLAEYLKEKGLV